MQTEIDNLDMRLIESIRDVSTIVGKHPWVLDFMAYDRKFEESPELEELLFQFQDILKIIPEYLVPCNMSRYYSILTSVDQSISI